VGPLIGSTRRHQDFPVPPLRCIDLRTTGKAAVGQYRVDSALDLGHGVDIRDQFTTIQSTGARDSRQVLGLRNWIIDEQSPYTAGGRSVATEGV
jgi:hypothetical protein